MEKRDFLKFLDNIFQPNGFKKKANSWYLENEVLIKKIEVQKSSYGNTYYLNYGFILKKMELENLNMHVFYGLSSSDSKENQKIKKLLDFENNILDEQRQKELGKLVEINMLKKLIDINSEKDIVSELKKRPHLNDVPLIVKEYLNLE